MGSPKIPTKLTPLPFNLDKQICVLKIKKKKKNSTKSCMYNDEKGGR